jgi:hypothetical protein
MWICQHPARPTFYLNEDIQGIISADHARRIANDVMGLDPDDLRTHVAKA